jgi:hypothetical protein
MQCTIAWIHSSMSLFLSKQPARDDDRDNPLRWVMLAPLIEASRRSPSASTSASTWCTE